MRGNVRNCDDTSMVAQCTHGQLRIPIAIATGREMRNSDVLSKKYPVLHSHVHRRAVLSTFQCAYGSRSSEHFLHLPSTIPYPARHFHSQPVVLDQPELASLSVLQTEQPKSERFQPASHSHLHPFVQCELKSFPPLQGVHTPPSRTYPGKHSHGQLAREYSSISGIQRELFVRFISHFAHTGGIFVIN